MPFYDFRCEPCDLTFEALVKHGDVPPCPTCAGVTEKIWTSCPAVIGDDIPGGMIIENLDKTPRRFDTKSSYRDELKARGLRVRDRHIGDPSNGSDKPRLLRDPQTGRQVRYNQKWV